MAITLVAHTKLTGIGLSGAASLTTPTINTTGANFIYLFYTFDNGGDYPAITDSKGNTYTATARENAFSPAMASEERFTRECVTGTGHTWTVSRSGLYGDLYTMSLYVAAFSGVAPGSNSAPIFSTPWYSDSGGECPPPYAINTSLSCGFAAPFTTGYLNIMGWGNTDANHDTVITATDSLGGTPTFTIVDHDRETTTTGPNNSNQFNAGVAYYIGTNTASVGVTQNWVDNDPTYNWPGGSQAVMSAGVFIPGSGGGGGGSGKKASVRWF